ncbi:MAG: flagellar hook-basal body complex protein [Phycisphaeraceae bacterium]|nr:flagellar hook-basal body complex protein [Phycisphaeraceae bacterium]
MSITRAMFSGLTGLNANSQTIGVAGNNIANVNTTSFKRSQAHFETQVSQTLKNGSAPSSALGGTNPAQAGLGTRLAAITRDFSDGGLQPTGVSTHAAIEGNGFFVVEKGGSRRFTRDGTFQLDRDFNLVTNSGARVQGYGVDTDFNVVPGLLQDLNIPLGILTIAQATENVNIGGNLNTGGDVATQGSIIESEALYSDALATTPAVAGDLLTGLFGADGSARFPAGAVLSVGTITRGGAELPTRSFEVGAANTTNSDAFGTTLGDFMTFIQDITGIDTTAANAPGVTVNGLGQVVVESNTGVANELLIDPGDIIANSGGVNSQPFTSPWTTIQEADGESARTSFIAYDSLGNPLNIDMITVLEDKNSTGTEWNFYIHSDDDSDLNKFLSRGSLSFDTNGQFTLAQGASFVIDRTDTGALDPQNVTLQFTDPNGTLGSLTALSGLDTSQVNSLQQDGTPIGTLEDFSISEDGTITGVFSNSLLRDLGQLPLAMFSNTAGLQEVGGNLYANASNSGSPQIVSGGTGGSGRVIGRALELSNVDLAQEFISLISAQTGFSANSRIISTSDQMIQELLATIR